jgi:hypothetical protein
MKPNAIRPSAAHGSVRQRDSRPPGDHDDGPTRRHAEHRPSKAMRELSRALKPHNSGNPYPHEHDRICSRDGHDRED